MPLAHANGIDIAYESAGREGDPAILLIMGFATPLTGWPDSLCEGLAGRGFRVVRFDNRDIGSSTFFTRLGAPDIASMMAKWRAGEKVDAPYALDDMAADAAALLATLRAPSVDGGFLVLTAHTRLIGKDSKGSTRADGQHVVGFA